MSIKHRASDLNMAQDVAVIGAGAVGLFYGAKLQKAGSNVQFQSRYVKENITDDEIKVKSIWGDFSINADIYDVPGKMRPADIIILATKYLPNIDFESLLKPVVKANSIIVVLQNGINHEETLQQIFAHVKIVGALAFTCINRIDANNIHHLDYGLVKLGSLNAQAEVAAKKVYELFDEANIRAELCENLRQVRWQKLLWNVPYNPLSVVCQADTKQLMANQDITNYSRELMKEVQAIATADGISITDAEIEDMIDRTVKMQPYKTSMLLDHEMKKSIEIEAILGEPIRIAKSYGLDVPRMQSLYAMLSYYAG